MKYCNHCILPDTRPNLFILEDGRCNACHSWSKKQMNIDWNSRKNELIQFIKDVKQKTSTWDCIIPVSGGKDSTWQVIKALEFGLKPLCITWRTPARNQLGQRNLDNLIRLGVDHIDFSINPTVEKIFTMTTLKKSGSLAIPMHMALFAIPLRVAVNYKIPLVLWGENSAIEYGGTKEELLGFKMTNAWLKIYGVTQATIAEDWISDQLSLKDLSPYIWPTDSELDDAGVTAAFLGWYLPWDPVETYLVAKSYGFQSLSDKPKTGYYQFADVDDEFIITIHHWLKWYKFGFTRLWDNLAIEIRSNRMTRKHAIEIIRNLGNEYPREAIQKFCQWAELTEVSFLEIANSFRNENIWVQAASEWEIKNFLINDWEWKQPSKLLENS
ncbi:MAG TPA: N-acetyl sugar amidotransferase [Gammaproteobacteria bacterium]|nr:N-acetyl sugar amidotransferase [Gammaproteobacteria bacterium]